MGSVELNFKKIFICQWFEDTESMCQRVLKLKRMETKKATKLRSNFKYLTSFFFEKGKGLKGRINNNFQHRNVTFVGHTPIKFTQTNTHSSQRLCPIVIANYINGYFSSFRQSENIQSEIKLPSQASQSLPLFQSQSLQTITWFGVWPHNGQGQKWI